MTCPNGLLLFFAGHLLYIDAEHGDGFGLRFGEGEIPSRLVLHDGGKAEGFFRGIFHRPRVTRFGVY